MQSTPTVDRRGSALARPILLSEAGESTAAEIGGKAASLVRLATAGFRVPEGVVLPAAWFCDWWGELRDTTAWADFARNESGPWAEHCARLQAAARELRCSPDMRAALDEVARLVTSWGPGATCAVRSSSPEEDLVGASFAGGYVTVLGVKPECLEAAVRDCFVSTLDERVVVYKQQQGFDVHRPSIAVLVQRQIDSEVAGVGFSINPVTNDFDEAVIDANFGLGESVVSGEVTPDHFVIDKPGRKILERRLGSKGVSRWLRPDGGVEVREQDRSDETSLSDAQVLELTLVLERIEALDGHPVDIEWAYAKSELHLLQSRPVTTYVPLPPEMLTEPGAHRRLYHDGGLTENFTTNTPLSRLTLDTFDLFVRGICKKFGVPYTEDKAVDGDFILLSGSRYYVDFSKALWLVSPKRLMGTMELMDPLMARTVENVDRKRYRPRRRPSQFSPGRLLRALGGVLWKGRRTLWRTLLAFLFIARFKRVFHKEVDEYEQAVADTPDDASVSEIRALSDRMVTVMMDAGMAAIYPWFAAISLLESMRKRADTETSALLDSMNRGYEGELVVEMGIDMFAMTHLLEASDFSDIEALAERIQQRAVPETFLQAWDAFLERYGCRGPLEMELSSPRYGDSPFLLLRQMSFMAKASSDHDPGVAHARAIVERKQALVSLLDRSGWFRRFQLKLAARWIEAYAGERDTPKHHMVMLSNAMRRCALSLGAGLAAAGRLDSAEDVFHLRWAELEALEGDPALDLRSLAAEHRRFFKQVESQVREFPHLIDSRGRILRPAPVSDEAALVGLGISPGIARGPIKVLSNPYDKEVEPGDILVAYTTDPGWTPLFVNAAAIILQVGGVMQHGGVVAREYGKPCVAGIEGVLSRFEDGQIVEVDGSSGRIRLDP